MTLEKRIIPANFTLGISNLPEDKQGVKNIG